MSTNREQARAAEKRYRQSVRGRAMRREQRRRWRARNPHKVQARVQLLAAHGERLRQKKRLEHDRTAPTLSSLSVADTRRAELKRLSVLISRAEDRGDEREVERLQKQYALIAGPAKRRPGLGAGITGLDLGRSDDDPVGPFDPLG